MRTRFWASILAIQLLCFAGQREVALPLGGSLHYSAKDGQTTFGIREPGAKSRRLSVDRDSMVATKVAPTTVKIAGERKGFAIVLVDTYPSIPGGMSYCQAGEESFLRVISIAKLQPKETLKLKLGSCRDNIELASPGLEWSSDTSTIHIHWLRGPSQSEESREIVIGPDGAPAK